MKAQQINKINNHRNRLNSYFGYLLHQLQNQENFYPFKLQNQILSSNKQSSNYNRKPPKPPKLKKQRQITKSIAFPRIDRYASMQNHQSISESQSHSIRQSSPHNEKQGEKKKWTSSEGESPPIKYNLEEGYQKYFNVHKLETIKLDQNLIKLIVSNQNKKKSKRVNSYLIDPDS